MTVTNPTQAETEQAARKAIAAVLREARKHGVSASTLINEIAAEVAQEEEAREEAVDAFRKAFRAFQASASDLREAWESEHVNPMAVENYPEGWETFEEEELKIASMELGQVEL